MRGNEYQKLAMRTNDHKATERITDKLDLLKICKKNNIEPELQDYDLGGIFNACLGLSGEVGEFNDISCMSGKHGTRTNTDTCIVQIIPIAKNFIVMGKK